MNHTDLINHIIKTKKLRSYLEVGTFQLSHNFDKIVAPLKYCIDPDPKAAAYFKGTSDEFYLKSSWCFDLQFLDGLHHADQLKKDFENALEHMNDGGYIVMHDTNPLKESITHVPRDNGEWTGNCYQFACELQYYYGIDFITWEADYGCTIVKRTGWPTENNRDVLPPVDWPTFDANRKELLRLADWSEVVKWVNE